MRIFPSISVFFNLCDETFVELFRLCVWYYPINKVNLFFYPYLTSFLCKTPKHLARAISGHFPPASNVYPHTSVALFIGRHSTGHLYSPHQIKCGQCTVSISAAIGSMFMASVTAAATSRPVSFTVWIALNLAWCRSLGLDDTATDIVADVYSLRQVRSLLTCDSCCMRRNFQMSAKEMFVKEKVILPYLFYRDFFT